MSDAIRKKAADIVRQIRSWQDGSPAKMPRTDIELSGEATDETDVDDPVDKPSDIGFGGADIVSGSGSGPEIGTTKSYTD